MKHLVLALFFSLSAAAFGGDLSLAGKNFLGRHYLAELDSNDARDSILGTKSLWIELSFQAGAKAKDLAGLEGDLKEVELEGQLEDAGLKVLDPKKKSLALTGQRPTLILSILYFPKTKEGNDAEFYLVWAKAIQEMSPLGGKKVTLTSWAKLQPPVLASGDAAKDREAIRAAAKASVKEFVDIAQGNDEEIKEEPKP